MWCCSLTGSNYDKIFIKIDFVENLQNQYSKRMAVNSQIHIGDKNEPPTSKTHIVTTTTTSTKRGRISIS